MSRDVNAIRKKRITNYYLRNIHSARKHIFGKRFAPLIIYLAYNWRLIKSETCREKENIQNVYFFISFAREI